MAVLIFATASGCATTLGISSGNEATSRAAEPPASWESAILFQFRDSLSDSVANYAARVEFDGQQGTGLRIVSGRDVYLTESNFLRTPWYRLWVAEPKQIVIRIVLDHPHGGRTVADYPLTVKRDEFYYVLFGVATLEPEQPHRPYVARELKKYAVPAEARRQASDSLWIGYYTRGRDCFSCPQ